MIARGPFYPFTLRWSILICSVLSLAHPSPSIVFSGIDVDYRRLKENGDILDMLNNKQTARSLSYIPACFVLQYHRLYLYPNTFTSKYLCSVLNNLCAHESVSKLVLRLRLHAGWPTLTRAVLVKYEWFCE